MQVTFSVKHGKKPLYEETVTDVFLENLARVIEMWHSILNDGKGILLIKIHNGPKRKKIQGCPEECYKKGQDFINRHAKLCAGGI